MVFFFSFTYIFNKQDLSVFQKPWQFNLFLWHSNCKDRLCKAQLWPNLLTVNPMEFLTVLSPDGQLRSSKSWFSGLEVILHSL
jgi:hypothetical protein